MGVDFSISDKALFQTTIRDVLDYAMKGEVAYIACNLGMGATIVEFHTRQLGDLMWKITDKTGKVWAPNSPPTDLSQLEATLVHLGHSIRDRD